MTAQSRALEASEPPMRGPLARWRAIASVIRKDMALLGPYALAGAIWMFAISALVHTVADVSALLAGIGLSGAGLDVFLFGLSVPGLAAALILFVILLAQTNAASDTRHDWLIRPITPLELVAAKLAVIVGVIVAPMILGNFVYMGVKAAPPEEAFAFFLPVLACCALVMVLSWLASTPFRAVLSLLGVFALLAVAIALAEAAKIAFGAAVSGGGPRPDPTPFPTLDDSWIVSFATGAGLCVVSGLTLWLLLARRRPGAARWLFVGYLTASVFLQSLLFAPIDRIPTALSASAALTRTG